MYITVRIELEEGPLLWRVSVSIDIPRSRDEAGWELAPLLSGYKIQ